MSPGRLVRLRITHLYSTRMGMERNIVWYFTGMIKTSAGTFHLYGQDSDLLLREEAVHVETRIRIYTGLGAARIVQVEVDQTKKEKKTGDAASLKSRDLDSSFSDRL